MELINRHISEYIESFTSDEPDIIKELVARSRKELEYTDMLSGRQVAMLLKLLIQISGAERILEVGTFTGYSAMMMADALPGHGRLITLEVNDRYQQVSQQFFDRTPFNRKIKQVMGDALNTIPGLNGMFDLVFLDADKINYPKYYELIKPRVKPGGLLIADNTLWKGGVLTPKDEKSKAIHTFNQIIREDIDTEQVLLAIRDGVTVVRFIG